MRRVIFLKRYQVKYYEQCPSDAQPRYNCGYANGMVAFLIAQGHQDNISHLNLDDADLYKGESIMEWHKAYHHGFEMGHRECGEVNVH